MKIPARFVEFSDIAKGYAKPGYSVSVVTMQRFIY